MTLDYCPIHNLFEEEFDLTAEARKPAVDKHISDYFVEYYKLLSGIWQWKLKLWNAKRLNVFLNVYWS